MDLLIFSFAGGGINKSVGVGFGVLCFSEAWVDIVVEYSDGLGVSVIIDCTGFVFAVMELSILCSIFICWGTNCCAFIEWIPRIDTRHNMRSDGMKYLCILNILMIYQAYASGACPPGPGHI